MLKVTRWIFLFTSQSLCALTTLTVTLSSDNNPGGIGEVGDLRYMLNTMNQNLNTTADDYEIIFATPMNIQLNGILPIINNSQNLVYITIGNPDTTITIDGNNGSYRGFFIPMGNVTIQNMNFQNLTAFGGNGGDGISGGGGGLGAGAAIYAPQTFLNGAYPSITLINVSVDSCAAIGGNGGSYLGDSSLGNEGGGGGGGFSGNGGSITTTGDTGGAGGGGFGGDGGDVTLSTDNILGGGGGGGGGIGSSAIIGTLANLGNGGSDQSNGQDGNGYGLAITAGAGAGGNIGGNNAGGGGGGGAGESTAAGGGGGGSLGMPGLQPQGSIAPGGSAIPSGGNGGDGAGGGGAGIVITISSNGIDGQAGTGGYAGGGGGGAGTGASDVNYTVQGGSGGVGGGGGGGGVNQSGLTPADGGNSLGGGGGGGGGPSNTLNAPGGSDIGLLGGGFGGVGAANVGLGVGGGGGGGGSALGGAIFVDSNLNLTIQALSAVPTVFNTTNIVTQAGIPGSGGPQGSDGGIGSALGNSIFLRSNSSLKLLANDVNDLLTLGSGVSFVDDTVFGGGNTTVYVTGNGTVVYNGTSDYAGFILINNANFKVNGLIDEAAINVCRDTDLSEQRGTLSGTGTLTGEVFVNSGTISPDAGSTLTLGSLFLSPANVEFGVLGSLVQVEIDSSGTSLVAVNGSATLAGTLEIDLYYGVQEGDYVLLTSSGITGTFDNVTFAGPTPIYTLSYLPVDNPTFVQFSFLGFPVNVLPVSHFHGHQRKNAFASQYELFNQLTWDLSPSASVVGYLIYRDGKNIATVNASTVVYQDHNRSKGTSYTYTIVAFDASGNESTPVSIVVRGH